MVKDTKLYDVLGVDSEASQRDIKMAYFKLAKQYHPDRVEGTPAEKEAAQTRFKEISAAYDILSDEEKRRRYDRLGMPGAAEEDGPGGGMDDPMRMFFGGGGGRRREPKPKDIVHQLEVRLEDLYKGRSVKLAITRKRLCTACEGSGSCRKGQTAQCTGCRGKGVRIEITQMGGMITQMQSTCPMCRGSGSSIRDEDKCRTCSGQQVVDQRDVFTVVIEKGMKTGDSQTFTGAGDQVPDVRLAGDVVIQFVEKPHPTFKRHGKYLLVEQSLSLADALCGFHIVLQHLDGRHLSIMSTPGQVVKAETMYSVHHEGMPIRGSGGAEKGDLLVLCHVVFPPALLPKTHQMVREVLGPMKKNRLPPGVEFYATTMQETHLSFEQLGGKQDSDEEDEGPRGGTRVQCATQ